MTARSVRVDVPGASYDVLIGEGLLAATGEHLRAVTDANKVALITDDVVAELHGIVVDSSIARGGFEVVSLAIGAGESSKNWATAGELVEALAVASLGRDDVVVALGGGVVGDIAGFVAAVYLRGVAFVQIPTTLLAMVDSSVGGKTAVDLSSGKNLAGAFKQPLLVLADTNALRTLPEKEWQSGLAEVIKSAVLDGDEFMSWLEANANEIISREPATVAEMVERCVRFKASVVARDEREEGPRECLNYGHTLGHAVEKVAGYGVFTHGAAVAEGVRFAARVSMDLAGADTAFVRRQDALLDRFGLPSLGVSLPPDMVFSAMRSDKKVRSGQVRMVLAESPGVWRCEAVADDVVRAHLEQWCATMGGKGE